MIFLETYFFAVLLVALRLGWFMAFSLDQYDWQHNKFDIWGTFIFFCLAWPLLLVKPTLILNPETLFRGHLGDFAARPRKLNQLWKNPPPCGLQIQYQQKNPEYGSCGEFLFDAADAESLLIESLGASSNAMHEEQRAILNWLRHRDEDITELTAVPEAFAQFENVANDLIRSGVGTVRCITCKKEISREELVPVDDKHHAGWNFERITCPDGHYLLVVRSVHLYVRH